VQHVIRELPVWATAQSHALSSGDVVAIKPFQPIVWISVTSAQDLAVPDGSRRFPAVIDTGFNQTLLIQDTQLRSWAGIDPSGLQLFPQERVQYGALTWSFRIADLWLHPNIAASDKPSDETPHCLEAFPGILVVNEQERIQRLPVLGMRALAWAKARLALAFDGPTLARLDLHLP
jgi:hypothetical protein